MTRDELSAAVAERLRRVAATRDLTLVLEPGAEDEAIRLTALLDAHGYEDEDEDENGSAGDAEYPGEGESEGERKAALIARHRLGWLHWYRYRALPDDRPAEEERELDAAAAMFTPCLLAGMTSLPEPLRPLLIHQAVVDATALLELVLRSADPRLPDRAVRRWRRILDVTPGDHPDRDVMLANLAITLLQRFGTQASPQDLDAAVDAAREATRLTPAGHPALARRLSNLGLTLRKRYEHGGRQADLEEAIQAAEEAVVHTPEGHPDRPAVLANLGMAQAVRFGRDGMSGDLDEAVRTARAALDRVPADHPDRPTMLNGLAVALRRRTGRGAGDDRERDLDDAVDAAREAVSLTPADHPDRAGLLSNLGLVLRTRYEILHEGDGGGRREEAEDGDGDGDGDLRERGAEDIDEAIEAGREALSRTPRDHSERAARLSNLGLALRIRFEERGAATDLDEAIDKGRDAVGLLSPDHPDLAGVSSNLGLALRLRHLTTRQDRTTADEDLHEAVSVFTAAARTKTAAPSLRVYAARSAADLTVSSDPGRAADLLEHAVRLLPQVAPGQQARGDQQYELGRTAGLAGEAASLALAGPSGSPGAEEDGQRAVRALRLLEAGRAVLLSQALDVRGDLTELRERHTNLAERFTQLRALLDGQSGAPADRRRWAAGLTDLLARIRGLEGFSSFARPPALSDLLDEAGEGAVVAFAVSRYRSDALLLHGTGVTALPLPGLIWDDLLEQIRVFHRALESAGDAEASRQQLQDAQKTLRGVLEWLWDRVTGPVLDALGHTAEPAPGEPWPRVWWATGGVLGLLPVHAAGHHGDPPGGPSGTGRRTVMDRVVSSHTPTVRALSHARRRRETQRETQRARTAATNLGTAQAGAAAEEDRSLIVAMPVTPGAPPLHKVRLEVQKVSGRLPRPVVLSPDISPDPSPDEKGNGSGDLLPTRDNVLAHLPGCAVAHFSCHGEARADDPSSSRLFLLDHETAPFTVAGLAPVRLDRAQLAYLSACRTAFSGSTRLADEAIHLVSAFQLAGFPHVVGTQWEISDARAVEIADLFYTETRNEEGEFDSDRAAFALHRAVRKLRDRIPRTPFLWAAFVHAGA
ncbi:CHAT domain-containing tetratricopeptide repeat protein [Streptomyces sp. HUAS TT20]|uniref:CHAT domain-containing tetratricopeptide repeat protein n=1 Tax=Streptomyces sp. HUAS TT20 TaxID=3447509 RepID=UPI0021DA0435|nr:CHAT domain-containing protein [Streptomyces sp. HUAS 15-9]UXY27237.1 CHAT domain-containing protein [Streptomyces sp. HUAS 15-9]